MRNALRLLTLAGLLLAGSATAQNPVFIEFGNNSRATDVTTAGGDVIVVGVNSAGNAFRWTKSSGVMTDLGPVVSDPKISDDGSTICATTTGQDGQDRAARRYAGTWTQSLGLGSQSGTSESSSGGISGDGQTVTGLGWVGPSTAHCFSWNQTNGVVDLCMLSPNNSNRGNAANADGSVITGFHDQTNGTRQGTYWLNGIEQQAFSYFDAPTSTYYDVGMGASVSSDGTIIVGQYFYGASAPLGSSGWRWDAATGIVPIPNLPGENDSANPVDVSDDGSLIVGDNGWDPWFSFSTLQSVLWVNNVPQSLYGWAAAQGTAGMGAYTDLGWPAAISHNGKAICGTGGGFFAMGTPAGGWVIILPSALEPGTSLCEPGSAGVQACPCGNAPAGSGLGCNNSSNTGGAHLAGAGVASLAADTLVFTTSGEKPNATSVLLQGSTFNAGGLTFGQGVRCVSGTLKRLYVKTASAGSISAPSGTDQSVSTRSASLGDPLSIGAHRYYGVYYRDPSVLGGCPAIDTYNVTQQLDVLWAP